MKKGFTLIEMLGVIIVLAIIGMITIPIVTNVLKESKESLSADQEKLIIAGARAYANAHVFDSNYTISVDKLMDEGYLDKNNDLKGKYNVIVSKANNKFEFQIQKIEENDVNISSLDFTIEDRYPEGSMCTQSIEELCHDDQYVYWFGSGCNDIWIVFDDGTEYSMSTVINNKILTMKQLIDKGLSVGKSQYIAADYSDLKACS